MIRIRRPYLLGSVVLALVLAASPCRGGDDETRARVDRMYAEYKENSFSQIPDLAVVDAVSFADSLAATATADDDVVWLDVRDARERRISVLPEAIDRETYEDRREDFAGRPVIVYCTIGYRSGLTARDLRRQGIEAHNLAGGILAWAHEGGDVVDGRTGAPTRRVHVYGWRWNLLPEGWQGVW